MTTPRSSSMSRLLIEISDQVLEIVSFSTSDTHNLVRLQLPIPADNDYVGALEALVYDNPELLADYASVDILFDTQRFMLVPADKADDDHLRTIVDSLWPDGDFDIVTTDADSPATVLAVAVDRRLLSFVRRTFSQARLSHRLRPLCRYFALGNLMRNTGKIHVHMHDTRIDIIAFDGENLLMANTFAIGGDNDALYYVLAAARQLNFDVRSDQVLISGSPVARDTLMRNLRQYFSNVMPAIFPADMFSLGADAMKAPFELIITPLCE